MDTHISNIFGIGRPRGQVLTARQQIARNVARTVGVTVATSLAAELTKATGSKSAGNIGKAVLRGTLGGESILK